MTDPIADLRSLYERRSLQSQWSAIESRLAPHRLATDYGLSTQAVRDLAGETQAPGAIRAFRNLISGQRDRIHEETIQSLHTELSSRSLTISPAIFSTQEDLLGAMLRKEVIVQGGNLVFSTPAWGTIDLSDFNRGLEAFQGGPGRVRFFYGWAILTGRHDLSIQEAPSLLKKISDSIRQGWKTMPIDWRRAAAILQKAVPADQYLEGYKRFAFEWTDGDMQKAYVITSALLSKTDFKKLSWGKKIPLPADQVEAFQTHLATAAQGLEGYKAFARTEGVDGNMHKAYVIASALLSKTDFQKLSWGKQILLPADQVEASRSQLLTALREGTLRGKTGCQQFADLIGRSSQAAKTVASALLSRKQYQELLWTRLYRKKEEPMTS